MDSASSFLAIRCPWPRTRLLSCSRRGKLESSLPTCRRGLHPRPHEVGALPALPFSSSCALPSGSESERQRGDLRCTVVRLHNEQRSERIHRGGQLGRLFPPLPCSPVPIFALFEAETCAICLEDGELNAKLECGHLFDEACLTEWLKHSLDCPCCRRPKWPFWDVVLQRYEPWYNHPMFGEPDDVEDKPEEDDELPQDADGALASKPHLRAPLTCHMLTLSRHPTLAALVVVATLAEESGIDDAILTTVVG